jgi:hypothetical protein
MKYPPCNNTSSLPAIFMKPSADIDKILFSGSINVNKLGDIIDDLYILNHGGFKEIIQLTPTIVGPDK